MTGTEEDSKVKVSDNYSSSSKIVTNSNTNPNNNISKEQYSSNEKESINQSKVSSATIDEENRDIIDDDDIGSVSSINSLRSDQLSVGNRSTIRIPVECNSRTSSYEQDVDELSKINNISSSFVNNNVEKDHSVITSSSIVNNTIDLEYNNVFLSEEQLQLTSKQDIITLLLKAKIHFDQLKIQNTDQLNHFKEIQAKLIEENHLSNRREKMLTMQLTVRNRQIHELEKEIGILKGSSSPAPGSLRTTFLDPAVNQIILHLKKELEETKKKLEDTQNDLTAWKFTPDSNTGKRLMAKCRMLYLENEDLGKQTSSGRVAKLENDLALTRQLVNEMKQSQTEMDEVVQELDEDIEGLQGAIQHLQHELREERERKNMEKNIENNSDLVTIRLSVLCDQCSSKANELKIQEHISSNNIHELRTSISSHDFHNLTKFQIENDERTTNSIILDKFKLIEDSNYKSVHEHANDEKEEDSIVRTKRIFSEEEPSTKRTKYEDTENIHHHNSSSFNGNH